MRIRFLFNVNSNTGRVHNFGDVVDLDDDVAKRYIASGVAEREGGVDSESSAAPTVESATASSAAETATTPRPKRRAKKS